MRSRSWALCLSLPTLCLGLVACTEPDASEMMLDAGDSSGGGDDSQMSEVESGAGSESSSDASSGGDGDGDATGSGPCTYPEGAVEPMALDAVLSPYSWPEARRADGLTTTLALTNAYCDDDAVIDWSPHEVLVFISIPAW